MKITLLFLFLGFAQSYAKSYSQEVKLDLDLKNVTLRKAFRQIEKASDYRFLFNEKEIPAKERVDLSASGESVRDILDQMLAHTLLSFRISESGLIVVSPMVAELSVTELTGSVKDEAGDPVIGATIQVKGANAGTVTDANGNFSLDVPDTAVLVVSYIGFETQEVPVNGQASLDIVMSPSSSTLDEVVVIGYGTQRVIDNTSAISSIDAKELTKTKVMNPTQAIQGKMAGVQVTASDEPGSTPSVMIRGMGTVLGGRNPLYVVDGMFADNINNLNANDIQSYEVLKDASALAIYGNRGANGVIIITTKKGQGALSVEYNGFVGTRSPLRKVGMASANEFAKYTNAALGEETFSENQTYNTDWFKTITRPVVYQEHNVNISGSSDNIRYLFSFNDYKEKGLLRGSDFNRNTLRSNNDFTVKDGITLSQNLSLAFTNNVPKPLNAFTTAYKQSPLVPVRFKDGRYGVPIIGADGLPDPEGNSKFNNVGNPLAEIELNNQKEKEFLLQGGAKLDLDFDRLIGINGLHFTSQFNGEYDNAKSFIFDNGVRLIGSEPPSFDNQLTNRQSDYFNWVLSNYFNYYKNFGHNHNIEATLGMESSSRSGLNVITSVRENVDPQKNYWNLEGTNYADNITQFNSQNLNDQRTISYFGRVQYKFMDRYLITGTLRRDGSSQFSSGNKWGNFPSFGAGWVLSKENFLIDNNFIDFLKIRGGWGRLGNQNVPLNIPTFASGRDYVYSFDGSINSPGLTVDQTLDPNLGWEVTEETSGGVDFGFLDSRLTGSVDVYSKKTKNVVLASIPASPAGISIAGYTHMGEVSNRGIEVGLGWQDQAGEDFSYSVNANYSYNKNSLRNLIGNVNPIHGGSLGNGQWTKNFDQETVGHPLGSFYLWRVDGFDEDGGFAFFDANGNGETGDEDSNDRLFMGSYIPKSTLGISINLQYKSWDLSIDSYGAFGSEVYNGKKAQRFSGENIERSVARDYWTSNNKNAANPAPFNAVPLASSYYLESGNYFRINNMNLGYNFEEPLHFIQSLRVYAGAINPFIFQKFSGYTPELNADGDPYKLTGIELAAYPKLKSFVFGIDVRF